jgi:membrane protein
MTSYAISASKGLVGDMPGGVTLLLDTLQFVLVAGGMAALFRYVPNTYVRWGHAWMGGVFVSAGMELAKKGLAYYLGMVPTYSVVYGAFATLPILLIWIYVAWVIVLLGATLTAYVPNLLAGVPRKRSGIGWQFQLALEVLGLLDQVRDAPERGFTQAQLCRDLQVDAQRLEPVMEALAALDWVALLAESVTPGAGGRWVLLVNADTTELAPLMRALLLPTNTQTENLWKKGHWPASTLREVL